MNKLRALIRELVFAWNYMNLAYSRHPSWRIWYVEDGKWSEPLRKHDAAVRAKLYNGTIHYCRDWQGDLIPREFMERPTGPVRPAAA